MRRVYIVLFIGILIFVLPAAASALRLSATPLSGTSVLLSWDTNSSAYDIWQTTDGKVWAKIYTTQPGNTSYEVTSGIQPYVNYYFALTTAGEVTDYTGEAIEGVNASNEAAAYPPNPHAHAYYAQNTDRCKDCHITHRAVGPKLLNFATTNDTCMSCHDGTKSKYKITTGQVSKDGTFTDSLISLAGPYGSVMGKNSPVSPLSVHTVNVAVYTAPGGNPAGSSEEWTEPLGCGSCHDAHGSPNYRMITRITPDNGLVRVKAYAVTDFAKGKEDFNYISGVNEFCAGCHRDLDTSDDIASGSVYATDTYQMNGMEGKYRHRIGIDPFSYKYGGLIPAPLDTTLPLEGRDPQYNKNKIICLTCHFAHGSTSATTDTTDALNDGGSNLDNNLLRLDYRGVCQECHQK